MTQKDFIRKAQANINFWIGEIERKSRYNLDTSSESAFLSDARKLYDELVNKQK